VADDDAGDTGPKPKGKGPGKDFNDYMSEVWDGGKKKVSNPNPKTRDSHPQVAVSTAMKDKKSPVYKQVMDGFKKWMEDKKDGGKPEGNPARAKKPDGDSEDSPAQTGKPDANDRKKLKKLRDKLRTDVLGASDPKKRGVYTRGDLSMSTVLENVTAAINKGLEAPLSLSIRNPAQKFLPKEYESYDSSIAGFRRVLLSQDADAATLQSAYDNVKKSADELVAAAKKVKIPASDTARPKK